LKSCSVFKYSYIVACTEVSLLPTCSIFLTSTQLWPMWRYCCLNRVSRLCSVYFYLVKFYLTT
jgi:hypothetical protein